MADCTHLAQRLKIVHLSTWDVKGGAARAAWRLHRGLRELGHESSMLVRLKSSDDPNVHEWTRCPDWSEWELVQKRCINANRAAISNTYFSLSAPGCDASAHPAVQAADVIHLHWVSWFQSPMSILQLSILGKPIVWTLHDQRAFTGGCHFSAGCTRFENECGACPQLQNDWFSLTSATVLDQRDAVAISEVVSPSQWLADCAKRSAVFRDTRVSVIPNGIDTNVFVPQPKQEARRALQMEPDAIWFLFGGDNFKIKRKGAAELRAALEIALRDARLRSVKVRFASFGGGDVDLPVDVRQFGRVGSEAEMARLYSAADALLAPSIEDNLPNVMVESLCCGTPVIAFAVGGMPDAISDGNNGRLVRPGDVQGFANAIVDLATEREVWGEFADDMRARYDMRLQAQRYIELYKQATTRTSAVAGAEKRLRELFPKLLAVARKKSSRSFAKYISDWWRR